MTVQHFMEICLTVVKIFRIFFMVIVPDSRLISHLLKPKGNNTSNALWCFHVCLSKPLVKKYLCCLVPRGWIYFFQASPAGSVGTTVFLLNRLTVLTCNSAVPLLPLHKDYRNTYMQPFLFHQRLNLKNSVEIRIWFAHSGPLRNTQIPFNQDNYQNDVSICTFDKTTCKTNDIQPQLHFVFTANILLTYAKRAKLTQQRCLTLYLCNICMLAIISNGLLLLLALSFSLSLSFFRSIPLGKQRLIREECSLCVA